jgi:hypothetical protein
LRKRAVSVTITAGQPNCQNDHWSLQPMPGMASGIDADSTGNFVAFLNAATHCLFRPREATFEAKPMKFAVFGYIAFSGAGYCCEPFSSL